MTLAKLNVYNPLFRCADLYDGSFHQPANICSRVLPTFEIEFSIFMVVYSEIQRPSSMAGIFYGHFSIFFGLITAITEIPTLKGRVIYVYAEPWTEGSRLGVCS